MVLVSAGSPWGGAQAGLGLSQGGSECCGISGPVWRRINCCCSFGEGHWEPLKPHWADSQLQERALCCIPGLVQETSAATLGLQKSLWERRDGIVSPFCCFPGASGSVLPLTCPQVCKRGIESALTSGMPQPLKLQAVVTEPVLAQSHHPCSEHPGSVKPLSQRRSARHGCVTVILKIKMTLSFKIRLVLMC